MKQEREQESRIKKEKMVKRRSMREYRRWQEKQLSFLVGDQREGREKVLMGGRLFQSDTYCKKRRTRQQPQLT